MGFKSRLKNVLLKKRVKVPLIIFSVLVVLATYVVLDAEYLFGSLPTVEELKHPKLQMASELYDSEGNLIGKYFRENRSPVTIGEVSPYFYKGLIATEDVRFYEHNGVDWESNLAILWYIIKGDKRGGSTITQQLAKNLFKMRKDAKLGVLANVPVLKLIVVKFKEWMTAYDLEETYSKEEILLLYINTVDFGSHAFGIKAAAKTFFDKAPLELSISESAILIGLLKATTYYSPILHPDHALGRRSVVLSQMVKNNVITQSEADEAMTHDIELHFHVENQMEGNGLYFRSAVAHELSDWCQKNDYDIYTDGLKIYTTLNSKLQVHAEEAVKIHMSKLQEKFYRHWEGENPWIDSYKKEVPDFLEKSIKGTEVYRVLKKRFPDSPDSISYYLNVPHNVQLFTWNGLIDTTFSSMDSLAYYKKLLHCGFVSINPQNGHVLTWVGGIDFINFQYDHVYQSKRQPGSTFKPFIYAAAIDKGASPCDFRVDEYVHHEYIEDGEKKTWDPRNSDREFSGDTVTLRYGMARSINSIAAQLTIEVTPDTVAAYANRCGIKSFLKPVPSVGLGSNDVTLIELASSYAPFINGGKSHTPLLITRIEDQDGNVLANFESETAQALSPETAWLMSYMLRGTVEEYKGTSQALFNYDGLFGSNNIGGKTGTSSNFSDGWYVGITNELIGASWVGAEDRCVHFKTSETGEGMRTALPIFGRFMEMVFADEESGLKKTRFPKEPFTIDKAHDCRTKVVFPVDTLLLDSLETAVMDSLDAYIPSAHELMFD